MFCPSVYACTKKYSKTISSAAKYSRNDVDIEFETKAFQVCDKDGDGALDWQEVENCEVKHVELSICDRAMPFAVKPNSIMPNSYSLQASEGQ